MHSTPPHIISHHTTPSHTTSHRFTPPHTTPHHLAPHHTILHHLPSHNIVLTLPSTFGIFGVLSGLGGPACKMWPISYVCSVFNLEIGLSGYEHDYHVQHNYNHFCTSSTSGTHVQHFQDNTGSNISLPKYSPLSNHKH